MEIEQTRKSQFDQSQIAEITNSHSFEFVNNEDSTTDTGHVDFNKFKDVEMDQESELNSVGAVVGGSGDNSFDNVGIPVSNEDEGELMALEGVFDEVEGPAGFLDDELTEVEGSFDLFE